MPLYVYKCEKCEHEWEVHQSYKDDPIEECEECGEMAAKKQIARSSFSLQGNGWYATDYASSK